MGALFLNILNLAINASWLILAVIVARLFLKKAPKWIACLLWGMVAVRLLCPVSLESALSLLPSGKVVPGNIEIAQNPHIDSGVRIIDNAVNPVIERSFSPDAASSANPMQAVVSVASAIWLIGVAAMLIYALISFIMLKRKVRASVGTGSRVRECDEVNTPFILGICRPVIYVPSGINKKTLELVVAHEDAHLKRRDHWWKPFGFVLLSVYWFNPLCWVAYILLCRDIETACDEKVIRDKDRDYVAAYSQALLDCSAQRRIIAACPLAFGETGVKSRIKGVLNYKKPAFWVLIVAFIACVVVAACFMTNPKRDAVPGTKETIMTLPPMLSIQYGGNSFATTRGTYSWKYEDSEGNGVVADADSPHPLDILDGMPIIALNGENRMLTLVFEVGPEDVYVRCWDSKYAGDHTSYESNYKELSYAVWNHTVEIPSDREYIVEVKGNWKNGSCCYCFKTASEDGFADDGNSLFEENMGVNYEYIDGAYVVEGDRVFSYKKELAGRTQNAVYDTKYIVLTNNEDITFEKVDRSFYSSNSADSLSDTIIIGMHVIDDHGNIVSMTDVPALERGRVDNPIGLQMAVKDVTPAGCMIVFSQHGGDVTGELQTGQWYEIQIKNGKGEWIDNSSNDIERSWEDIAYLIKNNGTTEMALNWKYLYGNLDEGQYRIAKKVMDYRNPGDYDEYEFYAEFDIRGGTASAEGDPEYTVVIDRVLNEYNFEPVDWDNTMEWSEDADVLIKMAEENKGRYKAYGIISKEAGSYGIVLIDTVDWTEINTNYVYEKWVYTGSSKGKPELKWDKSRLYFTYPVPSITGYRMKTVKIDCGYDTGHMEFAE